MKCYKCNKTVIKTTCVKEGITLKCEKCTKCGEEFFSAGELYKFDILTGRRKMIRKFGSLGDSIIVRVPTELLEDFKIKPGDYGVFEHKQDGILIKPISAKEINELPSQ